MQQRSRVVWCFALITAFLGAGCSSHGVYPGDWGSLAPAVGDDCPALAGLFHNPGERAVPEGGSPQYSPPYLSTYFFTDTAVAARADRVRITGDTGVEIRVELPGAGDDLAPVVLRRGEHYHCEDGWLVLESSRWLAENVSGFESMSYRFRKANDGAIVVQVSSSGVGVVFVVPVAGSSTEWHRFLPAE